MGVVVRLLVVDIDGRPWDGKKWLYRRKIDDSNMHIAKFLHSIMFHLNNSHKPMQGAWTVCPIRHKAASSNKSEKGLTQV